MGVEGGLQGRLVHDAIAQREGRGDEAVGADQVEPIGA